MRLFAILMMLAVLASAATANDLAVTVYNSNLGVVSETRTLEFNKGVNSLAFTDVPSQIDPASVRFSLVDGGRKISILEQNYAYDLVRPEQMYARYLDKEIELVDEDGTIYSGTLLSQSGGAVIIEEKSGRIKIIQLENVTEISFPALPEGLITRPTLFWIYSSDFAGKAEGKVGYQTSGMNWSAEYVGVLGTDEKKLDLSGWASINNTSGKTFTDATLKLVAGDIHRATPARGRGMEKMALADFGAGYAGFEEKAFFEYHLYTLPRRATLADRENKQISLFEPARSTVEKTFVYRPERNADKVEVAIKFKNSTQSGLGLPLPAGRVRLFKADDDGSLVLLGEDNIDHTPRDENVTLVVGYAFDITAKETITGQTRVSAKVEDREFEIELANRKDKAAVVEIEKKLYGFYDIISSSHEYTQKDATTLTFAIPLQPNESVKVKFGVRYYSR